MADDALRIIHHLIGWNSTDNQDTTALELCDNMLAPEHFWAPSPGNFKLHPTSEGYVYNLCIEYWKRTKSRIPHVHLATILSESTVFDPPALIAIGAAARGSISNGSDVPDLIDSIIRRYKTSKLQELIFSAAADSDTMRKEPDKVRSILLDGLQDEVLVSDGLSGNVVEINSVKEIQARVDDYKSGNRSKRTELDIRTGFPYLDERVGGFRRGQVLLIVGQSKLGKSVFSASMALGSMLEGEENGKRTDILIANREMRSDWVSDRIEAFLMWRHNSMIERTPQFEQGFRRLIDRIREGTLTAKETSAYYESLKNFSAMKSRAYMVDPTEYSTLDDLDKLITKTKKVSDLSIVYLDAMNKQHMSGYRKLTNSNWEALMQMAEYVQDMALRHNVLIIGELQESKSFEHQRHVSGNEILAESKGIINSVSHLLRLWKVPGQNDLAEAQLLSSRFALAGFSVPLQFLPGDSWIREMDISTLSQIDALCSSGR
jgi:replicative DNA helicase